jgi:hypothetical protein
MNPQRSAQVLGVFQTAVVASLMVAWLAGFGADGVQDSGGTVEGGQSSLAGATLADALQAVGRGKGPIRHNEGAIPALWVTTAGDDRGAETDQPKAMAEAAPAALPPPQPAAAPPVQVAALSMPDLPPAAATDQPKPMVESAATASAPAAPPASPPLQLATADPSDRLPNDTMNAVAPVDNPEACADPNACIDRYLWAVYQRTPKEDSIKVDERRQVTVKRKGKVVTVTRTFTKLVDEDFSWKDPKAADRAGMPMPDYVVGGMDQSFKLKLFHLLRAAEGAGLSPGITSAFRDDYRQSIASGLKAASDRSYHGGSSHGGYGHGLAADVVSTKGETRDQRYASSEALWKWIDAHGEAFGIGRPYLDRDPPHVAPIDGKEYASHRGGKTQAAVATKKKHTSVAARDDHAPAKRAKTARSSKVRTI